MPIYLWIAAGGAAGASMRHLVNVIATRQLGHGFPWGTMMVNIAGSFIMGMLITLMALKWNTSQEIRAFLTTGMLGGFTTFSAFSLDFATLYERKQQFAAFAYAGSSVAFSLLAVFTGMMLVRTIMS